MSLWRDEVEPSPGAVALVVGVGMVAIGSLSRAFSSGEYLVWAIPGAAVGAAFALVIGRRSLGLALAALSAAALITLPAFFARELTFQLFPTPSSYRMVWTLFGSGVNGVLREAAPVPPDERYMLVIWVAALTLGFLAAAWVVVSRPAGAVVTALGVVAFAGAVGEGPNRDLFAFAAIAGAVAFFLAEGRHRIASWGHRRARLPVALGVPTLVVACLAALAGPAVLGADRPLFNLDNALRPRLVIIKPLADIQRQLRVDPPIEVMRVGADAPAYWRLTGLDAYDGREWVLEARPEPGANGPLPPRDPAPVGRTVVQQYRITSLLAPWLPAAYVPASVDSPVPFEVDPESSTLLLRGETLPGLPYTVVSQLAELDPALAAGPATQDHRPNERESRFGDFARSVVGDAETPLEMAIAIERHFRAYDYDETVDGTHTVERLDQFLAERRGYCEQFAAAMTLMLRSLGVPARVGVGFLPGIETDGEFVVSTRDAHAWVEALMPEIGWVSFDPTPGRGDPVGGTTPEEEEAQPTPPPPDEQAPPPTPPPPPPPGPGEGPTDGRSPLPLVPIVLGLAVVSAVPGAKRVRKELRKAVTGPEAALGAYLELVDRAADLGFTVTGAHTQREFGRHVFARTSPAGTASAGLVIETAVAALYGPRPVTSAETAEAWRAVGPALTALRRTVPWWRRLVAPFDPRSLGAWSFIRRGSAVPRPAG